MQRPISVTAAALLASSLAAPTAAQCGAFVMTPTAHSTGGTPVSIAIGDVDGDHELDLVTLDFGTARVLVMRGDGTGSFSPGPSSAAGVLPRELALGDLDSDGDLDLAIGEGGTLDAAGWRDFGLRVLWNSGNGSFRTSTLTPLPATEIQPSSVALGDLEATATSMP